MVSNRNDQTPNNSFHPAMKQHHSSLLLIASLVATSASAQLKITEVENSEAAGMHQDWWELTNFGNEAVSLNGYKFDDSSASLASATVLSNDLTIKPGESIVFVETMTPQEFREWWGRGLSDSAQIVTYTGSGLGLSSGGDAVNVWDSKGVLVDSVKFGAGTPGVSFGYDVATKVFGGLSAAGSGGAFSSAQLGDIGSPAAVPEPSTLCLLAAGLSWIAFKRSRNPLR